MPQSRDLDIQLDPGDLHRFDRETRAFPAELERASRRHLHTDLLVLAGQMRARVQSGPGVADVGLRRGIAAGIRIVDIAGGFRIEATSTALPAARRAMVAAYNARSFRHPVYGRHDSEVTQAGRPYFGYTIDHRRRAIEQSQQKAAHDAAATVKSGKVTGA